MSERRKSRSGLRGSFRWPKRPKKPSPVEIVSLTYICDNLESLVLIDVDNKLRDKYFKPLFIFLQKHPDEGENNSITTFSSYDNNTLNKMSDEEIDDKFKELLERKGMVSNELYCMCQSD